MIYVIFSSYGNDSIALIQWAHEQGLKDVYVVFSDTGWAADYWESSDDLYILAAGVSDDQAHLLPWV